MNDKLDQLNNLRNKTSNLDNKAITKAAEELENQRVLKKANSLTSKTLDADRAERWVIDYLINIKIRDQAKLIHTVEQDKNYLRQIKKLYYDKILEHLQSNNIIVRGYKSIEDFANYMVSEQVGYSVLEDAFNDPEVSDIYCINHNTIFVEKAGKNVKYHKAFKDERHYIRVIERFIRNDGKEINVGQDKKVDFTLYGDRGTATSDAISTKGYSLTIRKHREEHIVLDQLIQTQLLSEEMAEFFKLIIDGESNLVYAGITGSGKTTSLRALLDYYIYKNGKRTLVCEDTEELFLKNEHTLALVTAESEDEKLSIDLQDIIYMALRQKPKYIVVGEIRGAEAKAAVEAMETGHSTLTTMHAGTPLNAVNRLINKYLEGMGNLSTDIAERIVSSGIDYIVIQDNIEGIGRKITNVTEVSYDFDNEQTVFRTIFEFDFTINDFVLKNRVSPSKANHLLRRGVDYDFVTKWTTTGDEKIEKEWIDKTNKLYLEDKERRLKEYSDKNYKYKPEIIFY